MKDKRQKTTLEYELEKVFEERGMEFKYFSREEIEMMRQMEYHMQCINDYELKPKKAPNPKLFPDFERRVLIPGFRLTYGYYQMNEEMLEGVRFYTYNTIDEVKLQSEDEMNLLIGGTFLINKEERQIVMSGFANSEHAQWWKYGEVGAKVDAYFKENEIKKNFDKKAFFNVLEEILDLVAPKD